MNWNSVRERRVELEAFSVDDGWTSFIVVGLGDPHGLEGGEGSKDGTSDPDGVFSLWWSNDLDLHGGWSKSSDFLLHSVGNTWVHGGTSGKDVVSVKILTDVNVALHDGVVGGLVDTSSFHTEEGWLEEGFWATESFVSDGDDLSIWQFVALFEGGGGGGGGHLGFEVQGDVAKLFLDVSDDFTFSGGDEGVSSFSKDLFHVIPVGDDTVFNGVFQSEDTSLGLSFITDVAVFLTHTNHNTLMARTADNGWEDGSWCVISGETALDKSGSVVAY